MKLLDREFKQLDAMCERVEFCEKWPSGTIRGKSSKKEIVGYRNQIIAEAVDRKITIKNISIYFQKTVQSIYHSVKEAEKDKEYHKRRAELEAWLCARF